jgi:hypothetical protein
MVQYLSLYGLDKVQPFVFYFSDHTQSKKYPCFVKAKTVGVEDGSVILKLNTFGHLSMLPEIRKVDIPFYAKNNKMIWRGVSTGNDFGNYLREDLVDKFQHHPNPDIDVKYTLLVQTLRKPNDYYILAPKMQYTDYLKSKFLISVEGNDVATDLKWKLLSNSVVLMPKPKKCTWFMEDQLIPYVHYIPLSDDFNDLEEQYAWCLSHLDECNQIAINATKYMEQFMDTDNENIITREVLRQYFEKVHIHAV